MDGRYDQLNELMMQTTQAEMQVLLVHEGMNGSGFSVCAKNPEYIKRLPDILEQLARHIRASQANIESKPWIDASTTKH